MIWAFLVLAILAVLELSRIGDKLADIVKELKASRDDAYYRDERREANK